MVTQHSPIFHLIDLDNWKRRPYFEHYYNNVKCTYSVTVEIDISLSLAFIKKRGLKLYPVFIYIISMAVNKIEELRVSYNSQGELGQWDFLSPCYTVFHKDDEAFTNIWSTYSNVFSAFNSNYTSDIEQHGSAKDFIAKPDDPGNTFPISCLPWLDFTAFNLNICDDARYLSPIFTFGKYKSIGGKTILPLSAQLHHALCDGYHAGMLFEMIREFSAKSKEWIDI